jgi:hypothetical protein
VKDCYEYGNKPPGSIKYGKFLDSNRFSKATFFRGIGYLGHEGFKK